MSQRFKSKKERFIYIQAIHPFSFNTYLDSLFVRLRSLFQDSSRLLLFIPFVKNAQNKNNLHTLFSCISWNVLSALVNPGLMIAADSVSVWLVLSSERNSDFNVSFTFPFSSFDFDFLRGTLVRPTKADPMKLTSFWYHHPSSASAILLIHERNRPYPTEPVWQFD